MEIYDPYGFIYITTNLLDGKRYIGQKKFDNASRWKSYLGSGYHLMHAIKKYGKENFYRDIIAITYSFEESNIIEKEMIDYFDAVNSEDYYNQMEGGTVVNALTKKNSIQCVCINNNYIFDSYVDAAIYSGYTTNRVADCTKEPKDQKFSHDSDILSFRKHNEETDNNYIHCIICGQKRTKTNNKLKYCDECAKKIRKKMDRERMSKYRNKFR